MLKDKQVLCGDSVRVAYPLFHTEGDGAIPISPLQLIIGKIDIRKAVILNKLWHSRLPILVNWHSCFSYVAEYKNRYYAVAIWGHPVARFNNQNELLELRRFAIAPDSPKYTASRMLKIMRLKIKKEMLQIKRLISYQDIEVHSGIIYKSSGWKKILQTKPPTWDKRPNRSKIIATGDKIRWEYDLNRMNNKIKDI